jgi:tuberous sclerosis protein 2
MYRNSLTFQHAIEKLWSLTEDLLKDDVGRENRHAAFQFLCSLAQGQADKLGLMRVQFFRVITSHSLPEDIGPR